MSMPLIITHNLLREDVVNDLLESVALEEAALSHIMNAEGEKMQKLINDPNATPESLKEMNESVEDMLETIAQLQFLLQLKAKLFRRS